MKIFSIVKHWLVAIAVIGLTACTRPESATRVLEQNGFRNIEITGYTFFSCSEDDAIHTGFTAVSMAGMHVSGTVCEGIVFKNSTIRFE